MIDNSTPVIGYENWLEDGTVTSDGTDEENAYNWLTGDAWTSGASSGYISVDLTTSHECDYYAVCGHNINTKGGSTKMQYWTGSGFSDIPESIYTPPDDNAFMIPFPSKSATQFRFNVTGLSAACTVAVVTFGRRLECEQGVTAGYIPPRFARQDTIYSAMAHEGAYIGRSLVRTGVSGSLDLAHLSEDWVRAELDPFVETSRTQGWFLLWSPVARPAECSYCWTTGTPQPRYEDVGLMSVSIKYNGLVA